jgi:hypothetical protein
MLTIPTVDLSGQLSLGGSGSASYPDWSLPNGGGTQYQSPYQPTEYYSSFIEPSGPITTIQMDLVGYTGTIKAQAAETYQSIWYNVSESTQYLNETRTIHMNIIGWHPLLRLCFNNSVYTTGQNGQTMGYPAQATASVDNNGTVTGVSVNLAGMGYLAPPLIEFAGDGAGARATATVSQGQVTGITVVDGGSGYKPIPPTMTGAQVIISTGRVENLLYR